MIDVDWAKVGPGLLAAASNVIAISEEYKRIAAIGGVAAAMLLSKEGGLRAESNEAMAALVAAIAAAKGDGR